jgi:hypothetical protein
MKSESVTTTHAPEQTRTTEPRQPGPNAERSRGPAAAPPGTYRYQDEIPVTDADRATLALRTAGTRGTGASDGTGVADAGVMDAE